MKKPRPHFGPTVPEAIRTVALRLQEQMAREPRPIDSHDLVSVLLEIAEELDFFPQRVDPPTRDEP